ncbi:hypothetical protein AB0D24_15430 [Streptomyces javensis]|uniref:hypothetical protein n=1 Tax=Streptomyces javensis TaxID=114698 RepID=UPI0033CF4773
MTGASTGIGAASARELARRGFHVIRELAPLGVRVVVVEPGAVRTEMSDRVIATANRLADAMPPEQRGRYGRLIQAANAHSATHMKRGKPADDAALITRLPRVLPDRMLDRILAASLRPHYPRTAMA